MSKDILGKIKKEQLTPKPKWYFRLLRGFIWTLAILGILFAAISSAIVARQLLGTDWELAGELQESIFGLLPYLWIIALGLFLYLGDKLFRKTKKGYRYSVRNVLLASLLLSVTLGSGLFAANADQAIEEKLKQSFKPYKELQEKRLKKFVAPDRGVVSGEITAMPSDLNWTVKDFKGTDWQVDATQARIQENIQPSVGSKVGMKGSRTDQTSFKADRVRIWNKELRRERLKEKMEQSIEERMEERLEKKKLERTQELRQKREEVKKEIQRERRAKKASLKRHWQNRSSADSQPLKRAPLSSSR